MENDSIRTKIQNLNPALGLNHRSFLLDAILKFDKSLWNDEEAKRKIWDNSEFITEKKYRWLLHLFFAQKDQSLDGADRWSARVNLEKEIKVLINA